MSLGVAIQSAIFYVVACTPCTSSRQRSKAKARAKRERLEKDRLEAENPGLYRQPSPFNTSPHWDEEIMMGPSLPKKSRSNGNSRNASQRRLTTSSSSGRETAVSSSTLAIASTTTATTGLGNTPNTKVAAHHQGPPNPGSSSTVAHDDATSLGAGGSENWNLKRYQREDEELWGDQNSYSNDNNGSSNGDATRTGHKLMDAIVKAGSSAGRLLDSTLLGGKERGAETREVTNEDRRNFYHSPSSPPRSSSSSYGSYSSPFATFRNPPVNDYHPPVVSSRPAHRDGRRWMLQPPPPVKVMEAKVPVSRSASKASTVSRRSGPSPAAASTSDTHLGRVVGERLVGAKIRSGEPFPGVTASADGRNSSMGSVPIGSRAGRSRGATVSSSMSKHSQRSRTSRSVSSDSDGEASSDDAKGSFGGVSKKPAGSGRRTPGASSQPAATTPAVVESEAKEAPSAMAVTATAATPTDNASAQGHAAQRPRLETILSSEHSSSKSPTRGPGTVAEANKASDDQERPAGASMDSGLALSLT